MAKSKAKEAKVIQLIPESPAAVQQQEPETVQQPEPIAAPEPAAVQQPEPAPFGPAVQTEPTVQDPEPEMSVDEFLKRAKAFIEQQEALNRFTVYSISGEAEPKDFETAAANDEFEAFKRNKHREYCFENGLPFDQVLIK